jgi:serine/threonine protein kinase
MHDEVVLRYVPRSSLGSRGNSFAQQFLEGVRFMHRHNVAHLDLKPDNIVITAAKRPQRLLIIDFSVSVRVPKQEWWIEGYRGTEGWAAPEIEEPNPRYQPIRADLWSAGQVLRYFDRQCPDFHYRFKSLADKLLDHDPLHRPLLSETRLHVEGNQMLGFKRKLGVNVLEKEGVKHRCLRSCSNVAPQDTLTTEHCC